MAAGMKQCKVHNKTVRAMLEQLSDEIPNGETQSPKAQFVDLRDKAADEPPSEFAGIVVEFEEKHPAKGRGTKRGHTPEGSAALVQKHRRTTGVKEGIQLVMMHETQWMKHRTENQVYPKHEAEALWDRVKAAIAPDKTDQGGPEYSRYRQPMPEDDDIDYYSDVAQDKEPETRDSKKRKFDTEEEMA